VFEITETAAIAFDHVSIHAELKNERLHFALAIFGTVFRCSIVSKDLPVDYLKIDGQFIENGPRSSGSQHGGGVSKVGQGAMGIHTLPNESNRSKFTPEIGRLGIGFARGLIAEPGLRLKFPYLRSDVRASDARR